LIAANDIVEQRDAVDRLAPWLRFGKFKLVALHFIAAIEPKDAALVLACGVEEREPRNAEPLGRVLPRPRVVEHGHPGEAFQFGIVIGRRFTWCRVARSRFGFVARRALRRRCDQFLELPGRMLAADREPVTDIAALRDIRPVHRQIKTPHALGSAARQFADFIGVFVPCRIVVVEDDKIGAGQLRAVLVRPFRFLARLAGAVSVACCRNADAPKIVRIFLALDDTDGPAGGDRALHFVRPIDDGGIDAFRSLFPAAFAIRLLEPEAWFAARKVADFAEAHHALGVAIDVGR
jgi:hypothetical protein